MHRAPTGGQESSGGQGSLGQQRLGVKSVQGLECQAWTTACFHPQELWKPPGPGPSGFWGSSSVGPASQAACLRLSAMSVTADSQLVRRALLRGPPTQHLPQASQGPGARGWALEQGQLVSGCRGEWSSELSKPRREEQAGRGQMDQPGPNPQGLDCSLGSYSTCGHSRAAHTQTHSTSGPSLPGCRCPWAPSSPLCGKPLYILQDQVTCHLSRGAPETV